MDKLDKLDCKLVELDRLGISSMSWLSCICRYDELAKLRMSWMRLISCTVSSMMWLSWT